MSGVKKLTSYFKKVTKDEREVQELLVQDVTIVPDCMPNNIIINDKFLHKDPRSFSSFFYDTLYDYDKTTPQ